MSYTIRQSGSWGRSVELPEILAVAGFSLACGGAGTLTVEVTVRGWWGFVTSPVDLIVVLGLLALSGCLSVWAFEHTDGWWRALAGAGIVVSMLALVVLLIFLILWALDEEPSAFTGNSNRRRGRNSRRRRY